MPPDPRPADANKAAAQPTGLPPASDSAESFLVVGIGSSAGGLEACRRLIRALPPITGMAFVLIQHLDPGHESLMADLLSGSSSLTVRQAEDGMKVLREHLYVIPPGNYLAVRDGTLHLSAPLAKHGARLPVDFFLHSLAAAYGHQAACLILSGTGADGSLGLNSIKQHGGLVIAQDPEEAGYDGMPRSAIRTGHVSLVLPLEAMPEALRLYAGKGAVVPNPIAPDPAMPSGLSDIIELLRARTAHDFTLYKSGTLVRRIERRMVRARIEAGALGAYLALLRDSPGELDLLAKDLLINVTSFFRDPEVFELLAVDIIPELMRAQPEGQPVRIWIAGCSTGEETYSLVMLFHEFMDKTQHSAKLQFFASDVDADAVASAREGLYPDAISADVSAQRLKRFFTKEGRGYRIMPDLRASVVFTVQDVLADPPFSRLDMVSCRNLLIYLLPEAQQRVFSLFHFALRKNGVLLLGNAENVPESDQHFETISKSAHLFRHVGRHRPGEHRFSVNPRETAWGTARNATTPVVSRQSLLADLVRKLVIDAHSPAAVLINRKFECLYLLGPTERFLHVAPGHPTFDLLAMALPAIRARLRATILRAMQGSTRIIAPGGEIERDGHILPFSIDIQPVTSEGRDLLLVCFIEAVRSEPARGKAVHDATHDITLERELEAARADLQSAIHDLQISAEDQKSINDEASSLNEELQSTNEELLTSKEELQSLNEELTALNTQLHEALERQRTTSNDLQNVLNSTNVATVFLDTDLKIRFFTPSTRSLFHVIPGDIGRPLADLTSLSADGALLTDARTVLQSLEPVEREIESVGGQWYIRRVLPYRTEDLGVEGVVITFVDSTERRRAADALVAAKRDAELSSVAKSRFLAAASHDLRQPLQSLSLLSGVLARNIRDHRYDEALALVGRMDETSAAMSSMLNALLDITQIDGGTVAPEITTFSLGELFQRLHTEFAEQADAQGISLRHVPSSQMLQTDRHMLGQMIRNIVANALKYTRLGKVLIGCRHRAGSVSIEVWDTGIGIPAGELDAIFEEYHQIDNGVRERNRGLGLGLSIVQRLARVLGLHVRVRSQIGRGSVFSIDIRVPAEVPPPAKPVAAVESGLSHHRNTGAILIVEDDPEVRELLGMLLKDKGHHITMAPDGNAALTLLERGMIRPDLLLADFNLPNGINGLQLAAKVRLRLQRELPVIILTGDMTAGTMRDIARQNCSQLNKPVKVRELRQAIEAFLPERSASMLHPGAGGKETQQATIFVVDDDPQICEAMRTVFEDNGQAVEVYATAEAFLLAYQPGRPGCLLVDAYLPGLSGLDLLQRLHDVKQPPPAVMITGHSDVQMVVQAMKAGAVDFIEKPVGRDDLVGSVERALGLSRDAGKLAARQDEAASHIASLTPRQREIMDMVLAGHPSKNIAADLDISQRTVENHRAEIMRRTGAKSLPALARIAISALPGTIPMLGVSRS